MPDNVTANSGSGGATFAAASLSFSGDTSAVPIGSGGLLTGSEGSWTFTLLAGGAGAVTAGTQRVTLASDDPAVSVLGATSDAAATQGSTGSISAKLRTVTSQLNTIASTGIPITGTVTVSGAVTNAGTFAVQESGGALTSLQLLDNIVLAEDAAHASGDAGVQILSVRRDTAAATAGTDGDYQPLTTDGSGRLWASAVQSGTWTVQIGNTANTTPILASIHDGTTKATVRELGTNDALNVAIVDGSGNQITTFGGSGGTSATDDAAFTAASGTGTPMMGFVTADSVDSGDVGVVGMLANRQLKVTLYDSSGVEASVGGGTQYDEDSAHVSGDKLTMAGVVRADTAAALAGTDGDRTALITDSTGRLWCNVSNTVTVASHAVTNAGTFAVQVDGSALTALQLIDDVIFSDDAAFTPATSKVAVVGFQADETSTDSVDEGDAGAARMTLDRKLIVTPQPHTAGGLSIFRSLDLDETEEEVKATAGQVYGCWVTNTATSTRWLKFYNATAANVTVGTTTPVITVGIPGNTSDDISGVLGGGGMGIAFDTAITVAATTGVADADTGAPSANDVIVNVFYK